MECLSKDVQEQVKKYQREACIKKLRQKVEQMLWTEGGKIDEHLPAGSFPIIEVACHPELNDLLVTLLKIGAKPNAYDNVVHLYGVRYSTVTKRVQGCY